eukprot:284139-Pyramimonas_sp.AAC.1
MPTRARSPQARPSWPATRSRRASVSGSPTRVWTRSASTWWAPQAPRSASISTSAVAQRQPRAPSRSPERYAGPADNGAPSLLPRLRAS